MILPAGKIISTAVIIPMNIIVLMIESMVVAFYLLKRNPPG